VTIDGRAELLYRTGDLGVLDADGVLHFRGRTDRQVKIRGYRVEPADVEHQVLRLLPAVRSCRVLARRTTEEGPLELVVFCVPAEPGGPLPDALSVLNRALVPHQRPAAVVVVDALPLTANGKLDEQALLTVASESAHQVTEEVQYRDHTERLVAQAFRSALNLQAVPPDVPFSQLGGTSLDAGRVCARLSAALGAPVPVSRLYQHPTVAGLAGWARETTPVPLDEEHGPVPLTPMQALFLRRHLADDSDRSEHCLLVWTVDGELDRTALEKAIAVVHGRHPALSASYLPVPEPHAAATDSPPPKLTVLPAQASETAAVAALREEFSKRLNLTEGEVWRTALVPLRDRAISVFGCLVHHIAFDGWSESVLAHDLATAYDQARGFPRALPPAPPAPPSPRTIHSGRQAALARAGLTSQRDRTAHELAGIPAVQWPFAPTSRSTRPGVVEEVLTPATVAAIDTVAANTGVSRFVVLLAQFAAAVAELTGQRDFGIGVPVAHRDRPGLDHVVGCHIDMTCLRMRDAALNTDPSGVAETGRIVRQALSAQDVPFSDQVALAGPQAPDRPALFQILFALQDNKAPRLDITGARSRFHRQHYLDLPLELHTELWPTDDGGLWMTLYHQPDVAEANAEQLAANFTRALEEISR
jgi:hypothetical protein